MKHSLKKKKNSLYTNWNAEGLHKFSHKFEIYKHKS